MGTNLGSGDHVESTGERLAEVTGRRWRNALATTRQ